jgi:transaldolase
MKLFLDTANVDEIREAASWGILDGVTTNPSLVAREGRDFKHVIREITSIVNGPISAEVTSLKAEEMVKEGRVYADWHENIYVKIPMGREGLKAVSQLSKEGIKVNITLIFSPNQALLAARAGASFISPFVGRLDDISHYGMDVIGDIVQIFRTYDFATKVLAASLRHPLHVIEAARAGADIATMPFKVLELMVDHPLTSIGQAKFLADWEKAAAQAAEAKPKKK